MFGGIMKRLFHKLSVGFSTLSVFVFLLFNQAQAQTGPKRPLIVIPGIVGSELSNDKGDVIWGRVSSLRSSYFSQLNLLPKEGQPVRLQPTDALRSVPLVFGTVNVGVYSDLINFLTGKKSILDSAVERQTLGNYEEGKDLFVFAYDWRRSNFANAVLLNEFVSKNIPAGRDFDIVAHSMGGLLTRAFLSDLRPTDFCTDSSLSSPLDKDQTKQLCHAVYGVLEDRGWRGIESAGRFTEAGRLHTFIEIATPQMGAVNVASTLVEGWGRLSRILLGGKRGIQDIIMTMVGMYELTPSYENCCALGRTRQTYNQSVAPLDETYWADLVLGFKVDPCPYTHCAIKRQLLRIGLANRRLMDRVFSGGMPDSVRANHIMVGRLVENTREVIYVDHASSGDGNGISYRTSERGDGTVYEGSAKAPGNIAYVLRGKHAFITGTDEVKRYVYNVLINPVDDIPELVSSKRIFIAGGDVRSLALTISPQIVGQDETVSLTLDLTADDAQPFNLDQVEDATVTLSARLHGSNEIVWQETVEPALELSLPELGELTFIGTLKASDPGIYLLSATAEDTEIAQEIMYVLEE